MRRNHWEKNHREEMIEKESWRRNHGGAIMKEQAWRRHVEETCGGDMWGASGSYLEASGIALRVIWEPFWHQGGTQRDSGPPGGSRRSRTHKVMPLSPRMQKFF